MAITPSSRWISKGENGSDEDSVPFEKSKKACFQIFFLLAWLVDGCLVTLRAKDPRRSPCRSVTRHPYRIFRSVSVFLFEN